MIICLILYVVFFVTQKSVDEMLISDLSSDVCSSDLVDARVRRKLPLTSSPLRRCRETGDPLAAMWSATARIDSRVGEIPSPIEDLKARCEWLRNFMSDRQHGW